MNTPSLPLPRARLGVAYTGLAAFALCVFLATWATGIAPPHSFEFRHGTRFMAVLLGLYLGTTSWMRAAKLGDAAGIINGSRAPLALWKIWLRTFLQSQFAAWAVVASVGTAMLWVSDSANTAGTALLLYCLVLACTTALPLAQRGLLMPSLRYLVPLALAIYLCIAGPHFYALVADLPLPAKSAAAAAAAGLLFVTLRRWQPGPPLQCAPYRQERAGIRSSIHNWRRRFTFISSSDKGNRYGSLWIIPYMLAMENTGIGLNHRWGSAVGLTHLLWLLIFAGFAGYFLCCRDLHWRHLLAPGGITKGRMGSHVIRSTLTVLASLFLPVVLAGILLCWILGGMSPLACLATLARHASLACEIVFMVCFATALRATRHWWLSVTALYGAIALAILAVALTLHLDGRTLMGPWFRIGPEYIAVLAATSMACTLVANRLWTTNRLLPLVVPGMKENNLPAWDWLCRVGLTPR